MVLRSGQPRAVNGKTVSGETMSAKCGTRNDKKDEEGYLCNAQWTETCALWAGAPIGSYRRPSPPKEL
jgi:hypothetical protein